MEHTVLHFNLWNCIKIKINKAIFNAEFAKPGMLLSACLESGFV